MSRDVGTLTRLGPDGYGVRSSQSDVVTDPRADFGTITRLGPDGYGVRRRDAPVTESRDVTGIFTRLGPDGYGVRRRAELQVTPPTPEEAAEDRLIPKHGAGFWKTYAPPHKVIKKHKDESDEAAQARALYIEARKEIPEPLQAGLLPLALQVGSRRVTSLPPARNVDFEKLADDVAVLQVLYAALQAAYAEAAERERKRKRRRRDEESFIMWLLDN